MPDLEGRCQSTLELPRAAPKRRCVMHDNVNRQPPYTTGQTSTQVIAAIANYCGRADQNGSDWKCKCPICGRHSLSLTNGVKVPILIRCWHCESNGLNDGYTEQRKMFI